MLEIKNLTKMYDEKPPVIGLADINLKFGNTGLISVMGATGSGKTTLLNVIGGMDSYEEGDLIVNEISTKSYREKDWDAYRNNYIGFVFQNRNLLSHLNVLENVELPLKLNGVSKKVTRQKAIEAIQQVGLTEKIHVGVTHLSGGETQLVGIARALVNDPQIILADEITSALDEISANKVMQIMQEIAKTRLVLMVTHNGILAKQYSERIVTIDKGQIISDKSKSETDVKASYDANVIKQPNKKTMNLAQTTKLAILNLLSKKFRTIVETIAMAFGIFSLSLVLALTTGFGAYIEEAQKAQLGVPFIVTPTETKIGFGTNVNDSARGSDDTQFKNRDTLMGYDGNQNTTKYTSVISNDFVKHMNTQEMNPDWYIAMNFGRAMELNLLAKDEARVYNPLYDSNIGRYKGSALNFQEVSDFASVKDYYEPIAGRFPAQGNKNEIALVVNEYNRINSTAIEPFGFRSGEEIELGDVVGKTFKWVPNDLYYESYTAGDDKQYYREFLKQNYTLTANWFYETFDLEELVIVGVIRAIEGASISMFTPGYVYNQSLSDFITQDSKNYQTDQGLFIEDTLRPNGQQQSWVVKAQDHAYANEEKRSIISLGTQLDDNSYQALKAALGGTTGSAHINIFAKDMAGLQNIKDYITKFNKMKGVRKVFYTDLLDETISVVNGISLVLLIVALVTMLTSALFLGIITYINVNERNKEFAIMRSIGAKRSNIATMINMETGFVGLFAGIVGAVLGAILLVPFNALLSNMLGIAGVAALAWWHPFVLIAAATAVTVFTGLIPAIRAIKKDMAKVLRSDM